MDAPCGSDTRSTRLLGAAMVCTHLALGTVMGCGAGGTRVPADFLGYWAGTATFRGAVLDISVLFTQQGDSLTGVFSTRRGETRVVRHRCVVAGHADRRSGRVSGQPARCVGGTIARRSSARSHRTSRIGSGVTRRESSRRSERALSSHCERTMAADHGVAAHTARRGRTAWVVLVWPHARPRHLVAHAPRTGASRLRRGG